MNKDVGQRQVPMTGFGAAVAANARNGWKADIWQGQARIDAMPLPRPSSTFRSPH